MTGGRPGTLVEPYLGHAVQGHRRPAVRLTLDLVDDGVPSEEVVVDLLAAAQREVGERWYRNELTVADEHVATGVTTAALDALANEATPIQGRGHTVVVCAEGDWHTLAAEMFGEALRGRGVGVTVLGASTPAALVADFLARRGADSLAVSCSIAIFFDGVARLTDAAHQRGFPVIVGGRAFEATGRTAARLGADAYARTAAEAAVILDGWHHAPPPITPEPTRLDPGALRLAERAGVLGPAALDGLAARFPAMATYDEHQLDRTREDLVFIVRFLAASRLVDDASVFTDFLEWLQDLLVRRGVPPDGLVVGLEALRPLIADVDVEALPLLDAGRLRLVDGLS